MYTQGMKTLRNRVDDVRGVGPLRSRRLAEIGIRTIGDVLYRMPRLIQDRRDMGSLTPDVHPGARGTVAGTVIARDLVPTKNRRFGIFKVVIKTAIPVHPYLCLTWFKRLNHRYDVFATLRKQFAPDAVERCVIAYGRFGERSGGMPELAVEDYELLGDFRERTIHTNRLVPVYSLTEGLSQRWFRELVHETLADVRIPEIVPAAVLQEERLPSLDAAIRSAHFPDTWADHAHARRRLVFDRFLVLQIAVTRLRRALQRRPKSRRYELRRTLLTPFRRRLEHLMPGFDFTRAQKRVINELFSDLAAPYPMNRILIGDVGSGKTLVALSCMLLAVENGHQAAFMAPTEILAEQHARTLGRFLEGLPHPDAGRALRIATYLGRTPKKEREQVLHGLRDGTVDIVVGTHALATVPVTFHNLGLAVVDEQHRFGVLQRQALYAKAETPDTLIMTATPIPRSLAMTVYGELDIATLDELPPGRKPVVTRHHPREETAWAFVKERLAAGEKAYIVYPVIDETSSELKSLLAEFNTLSSGVFKDWPCALLHGRMPGDRKDAVMRRFRDGEVRVLFATTVIEVGIDVPDATVIAVAHAERFGLATLHQLRGRVGRGPVQSYCLLIGAAATAEAERRIAVMCETNDGFRIAEEDLMLRGAGSIFGTRQHGAGEIRYADVLKYARELERARYHAQRLVPERGDPPRDAAALLALADATYGDLAELGRVG